MLDLHLLTYTVYKCNIGEEDIMLRVLKVTDIFFIVKHCVG